MHENKFFNLFSDSNRSTGTPVKVIESEGICLHFKQMHWTLNKQFRSEITCL